MHNTPALEISTPADLCRTFYLEGPYISLSWRCNLIRADISLIRKGQLIVRPNLGTDMYRSSDFLGTSKLATFHQGLHCNQSNQTADVLSTHSTGSNIKPILATTTLAFLAFLLTGIQVAPPSWLTTKTCGSLIPQLPKLVLDVWQVFGHQAPKILGGSHWQEKVTHFPKHSHTDRARPPRVQNEAKSMWSNLTTKIHFYFHTLDQPNSLSVITLSSSPLKKNSRQSTAGRHPPQAPLPDWPCRVGSPKVAPLLLLPVVARWGEIMPRIPPPWRRH